MRDGTVLYTVGHSNVPFAALLETLRLADIALLLDVRTFPMSRRNPQFTRPSLEASRAAAGIDYRHTPELGGRRKPNPDSQNNGLRDPGFRGFADYMGTPAFDEALDEALDLASRHPTAVMCAESVPWRCHRSLISDAALARGAQVVHLIGKTTRPHTLSSYARVDDKGRVSYPGLL